MGLVIITMEPELSAGSYLILVTNGTDPKQIITSTMVRVMPFNSTITVPTTEPFALMSAYRFLF
jgi:hypothetical protein